MSVGEVKEKKKVSLSTAKQWCEEARAILSMSSLSSDQRNLKSASKKSYELLNKLEELNHGQFPPGHKEKKQKYIDVAFEMQQIEKEYRREQVALQQAKDAVEGRFFSDKRQLSKEQWKGEKSRAEKSMQDCKDRMNGKRRELELLNEEIQGAVNVKEEQLKEQRARVTDKNQLKIIDDAQKALVVGQKLIKHFAKNYDPKTAQDIANAYAPYQELDWYGASDRVAKFTELQQQNIRWAAVKNDYVEGGKTYNAWIKKAREAALKVEELLSSDERGELLAQFYAGQDAALQKKWDTAGENIDEEFVTKLTDRLSGVQDSFNEWQEIKKGRYGEVKKKVSQISDGRFLNLALARVAEVIGETEKTKDYFKGIGDFKHGEKQANDVIAAFNEINTKLQLFIAAQTEADNAVKGLSGDALSFALPLQAELAEAIAQFRKEQYVPTVAEAKKVAAQHEAKINELKQKVLDCTDDTKVALLTKAIEDSKDATKFVQPLSNKLDQAKTKLFEFQGLAADDPTNKIAVWQASLSTAEKGLGEVQKSADRGSEQNFDRHKQTYTEQSAALDTVIQEITDAHNLAVKEVPTAQTALLNSLKALDSVLSDNRWMTFREATWHAAAVTEAKQLRTAAGSGSIGLLKEMKARADEMKANADKAFDYYLTKDLEELDDPRYPNLKNRISTMCKALKSKKLKRELPAEHGKVLGNVMDAESELREDGPGLMDKNHATWDTRLTELEREVTALKTLYTEIDKLRTACNDLAGKIKSDIGGKLCTSLETKAGKKVAPDHLPIAKKLQGIQAGVAAETIESLKVVQKKLTQLEQELAFSIEDVEGGSFADLIKSSDDAANKERDKINAELELQADYDLILEKVNPLIKTLKGTKGVDKGQLKKIKQLLKDAKGKAKLKDFGGARSLADLSYKLALQLERDPLASQMTDRGTKHLKELNPRWTNAINTLLKTVDNLTKAIGDSAVGDPELKGPTDVTTPFTTNVRAKIAKDLDLAAFQQELMVLSGDPPKKKEDQAKDEAKKRKIREQALSKLRRYRDIVQKNPIFTGLIMEKNPWSGKGGNVDGLPLYRVLNDLDLNLQRSV